MKLTPYKLITDFINDKKFVESLGDRSWKVLEILSIKDTVIEDREWPTQSYEIEYIDEEHHKRIIEIAVLDFLEFIYLKGEHYDD